MPPAPFATASLRLHRRFYSRGLRNFRDLVVWLPPGYGRGRRRHPVVWFHDGQNIFDPATAFLGYAWQAGERAAELIRERRIIPPIMVGVYNTGTNRMNELAPTAAEYRGADGETLHSSGDAKRYARFFVQEVMPFIESRYLTLGGPAHHALVGSSMGGLVSLYFPLWHPRVFGHVAALSPSVWWDNRAVVHACSRLRKRGDFRVWLDLGAAEPGLEGVQILRDTLVAKGWREGVDLAYREIPGAGHNEAAWAARIGEVLAWAFPRRAGPDRKRRHSDHVDRGGTLR